MYVTNYEKRIISRSYLKYFIGLIYRWMLNVRKGRARRIARRRGAIIGQHVILPIKLARQANANLVVGNHVSIQTVNIDLRSPVKIGNHVIIGQDVRIITASHNINSTEWEMKTYGLEIEDYVWIATGATILPSCRKLSYGTVVGGASVCHKNTEPMDVVSGNPAVVLKKRETVHSNLVVESLLGGDFVAYRQAWKKRDK